MSDAGGLFLLVTPAGGKLWRWKYRFDGKEKLMAQGKYPDVSLAQARECHAQARKLLADSIDPTAHRKAEKNAEKTAIENSFQSVSALWMEHWREGKSPRHVDYVKRHMETDILPCLGARPIAEIEAPELVAMIKGIQDRGARDIAKCAGDSRADLPLQHRLWCPSFACADSMPGSRLHSPAETYEPVPLTDAGTNGSSPSPPH